MNVQGDEPFQDEKSLQDLVAVFEDKAVEVASLKTLISEDEAQNPNFVKVITDLKEMHCIFPDHLFHTIEIKLETYIIGSILGFMLTKGRR